MPGLAANGSCCCGTTADACGHPFCTGLATAPDAFSITIPSFGAAGGCCDEGWGGQTHVMTRSSISTRICSWGLLHYGLTAGKWTIRFIDPFGGGFVIRCADYEADPGPDDCTTGFTLNLVTDFDEGGGTCTWPATLFVEPVP